MPFENRDIKIYLKGHTRTLSIHPISICFRIKIGDNFLLTTCDGCHLSRWAHKTGKLLSYSSKLGILGVLWQHSLSNGIFSTRKVSICVGNVHEQTFYDRINKTHTQKRNGATLTDIRLFGAAAGKSKFPVRLHVPIFYVN